MNFLRILSTKNYSGLTGAVKQAKVIRKNVSLEPLCTFQFNQHERFSTKVAPVEKPTLFTRIKNAMGFRDIYTQRLMFRAALLYEKTVDSINYELFFKEFELPDTMVSWFVITELHVWMLAVRLMADLNNGKEMRNILIEMMWYDYDVRMKKLGPISSKIKKKDTLLLGEQMNAAYVAYDEGISSDDRVLAGAIWNRVFQGECNNPEYLDKLVCYVRKETARFDKMPLLDLLNSNDIKWTNVKTCTNI